MLEWTSIIIAAIGTGGVTGLFLIAERKAAAALRNMQTQYDALQSLYDKLQARFDTETDKVGKLYAEIDELHSKLDTTSTRAAIAEMKVCDFIACPNRRPPLADHWRMDLSDGKEDDHEQ